MKDSVDPKQLKYKKVYLDPKSPTFGNIAGSLREAGYSDAYSKNASYMKPEWLVAIIGSARRARMFDKAEENLEEVQAMKAIDMEGKVDPGILKIRTDVDKFIAKGIGKETYSERTEHTGKDGAELKIVFDNAFLTEEGEIDVVIKKP